MSKLVRLVVSIGLLVAIGWTIDWRMVRAAFASLRLEYWLAALGILVATQFISAARWQLFARELRFRCSWRHLSAIYFVGMFFNLLLPTSVGGDVVRALCLDRGAGRKLAAFASVMLDRLNGLLLLVAMACAAVLLSPIALPRWVSLSVWAIAGAGAVAFAGLLIALRWRLLPAARLHQVRAVLAVMRAPRLFLAASTLSLIVQLANVALVYLVAQALNIAAPVSYYGIVVPMVSLLTLLPISLNGMGVREGGVVLFLSPLGVPAEAALTLAFLWFAVHVVCSMIGGIIYLLGVTPAWPTPREKNDGSVDCGADQGRAGQLTRAA